MRTIGLLLLLALLLPSLSCGGDHNRPPTPFPPPAPTSKANITGGWEITAHSTASPAPVEIAGRLENTGSQVTGALFSFSLICEQLAIFQKVSGTINAAGDTLSLSSTALAGQTLTITGSLSSDGKMLQNATYTITGGCTDQGTATGFLVPPFTNTYSGPFTSRPAGRTVNATISFVQSPPAGPGLSFSVTGNASFADRPCFTSGTLSDNTGLVLGGHISGVFDTNDGGRLIFDGILTDASGKTITAAYHVLTGGCANETGTAVLTVQ
jgi:hypothetical protein